MAEQASLSLTWLRQEVQLPVIVNMSVIKLSPHSGTFISSTSAIILYWDSHAVGDDIIASNFSMATMNKNATCISSVRLKRTVSEEERVYLMTTKG